MSAVSAVDPFGIAVVPEVDEDDGLDDRLVALQRQDPREVSRGDAGPELVSQVGVERAEAQVLMQQTGVLTTGEPLRVPLFDDAEPKSFWMYLLPHRLPYAPLVRSSITMVI